MLNRAHSCTVGMHKKYSANRFIRLSAATHIDQVLFEALAQVLYKGRLAGVVLQQDKVLHSHPVSGCKGRLHHRPHAVTGYHLREDEDSQWKNSSGMEVIYINMAAGNKVDHVRHKRQYWWDEWSWLVQIKREWAMTWNHTNQTRLFYFSPIRNSWPSRELNICWGLTTKSRIVSYYYETLTLLTTPLHMYLMYILIQTT